ncbi:MAG: 50S ribosomal protein L17 [Clostridia bacterium]|nr:50S ribosomal protein L17 [Clostridia bacterium]MBQ1943053.1 50S ribosomal protein L17 [Clostridia bacterium]
MRKLGRTTEQRLAVLRNQASNLLWYGKLSTTKANAKELQSYVEKIITTAINSYMDTNEVTQKRIDKDGNEVEVTVAVDGAKKLAARRAIMNKVYDLHEVKGQDESRTAFKARIGNVKHPLIEKIFNEIAPKYAERKEALGQGGGYTRIYLNGQRRGDAADVAIIELI